MDPAGSMILAHLCFPHRSATRCKTAKARAVKPAQMAVQEGLAMILLIGIAALVRRRIVDRPAPLSLQNIIEALFEALLNFMHRFVGDKNWTFFPVVGTFFLYILLMNWCSILPGFGSIGIYRLVDGERMLIPVLRGGTTDINTTLALAICSVVATQVHGIRAVGWGAYIGRFVAIGKYRLLVRQALQRKRLQPALLVRGSLDVFVGLLELFDELTKVLSFAFRLFGNVFGGEVLLMVMAFLMPFLASMPFMAMELFTGAVQAFVFAVLTTAFLGRATTAHAHETSDNVPTRDARGRSANNRTESPASPPSATAAGDALV